MKLEQNYKQVIVVLVCTFLIVWQGKAQTNMSFYSIENQINSPALNPAFLTSQSKLYFSLLPFTGTNLGYNNPQIVQKLVSNILAGDQAMNDFRDVFDSMIRLNLFYQRMEVNLLCVGYKSPWGSFDFRVNEKVNFLTDVNGDFSSFVTSNSTQTLHIGDSQSLPAFATHYREFSLGFAREFSGGKLSVGARVKMYFGKSSISSEVTGTSLQRDQDIYLQMNGPVKISLPIEVVVDKNKLLRSASMADNFSAGDYLMNSGNTGLGFDLGFSYKPTPDLVISGSVTDVGKIKWSSSLNSMVFNGEYLFPKELIVSNNNGVLVRDPDFSLENVDIRELYRIDMDNAPFTTRMPVTFYSGIKYRLDPRFSISLTNRFIGVGAMSFNSLAATGIYGINRKLSVSAGYAALGKSYNNIPFGLFYNGNFGQYYIGTDNLLSVINPTDSNFSGVTFGMCFYLFRSKEKYRKQPDYRPFYKEKVRRLKGTTVDSRG